MYLYYYCCDIKYEEEDKEEYGEKIENECNWIGRYYDREIREIRIEEHIKQCVDECFNGYTSLTKIELSPHLYKLPFKCFNNCKSLIKINIEYVTYIGDNCFSNCTRLKEIRMNKDIGYVGKCRYEIPTEVKRIGNGCFEGSQIKEITIPSNVRDIGNDCFGYCTNLTKIEIHEGIKEIPKGFMKYCGQIQRIELPQSITKINTESFKESIKLKEINIKPNTIIIEKGAFEKCPNINYE
ncbi:hypothetical protein, conserved [Entamoeba dispar SAW760]|uniref:Leucine rich repeat containing protein BspA family protein n=1 Tax=Entamoeba dispar (strain ATCC PRA-260 / SAW760) TaxID=370354 RepID=B0EEX7_ENTDS|nr:uncharacterized protein EDI_176650 [Entamoeba dispar SAW760]EDR26919.1 hypothetical protein, conserved [Entamoeba dispar SAW760]|eukprot:EDR26919.1 hypothetical protein, conserved [Entamoeba dispar SAW760]